MANTRPLLEAVEALAEVMQSKDELFGQATVGTVFTNGDLTVVDDKGGVFRVSPVTDEDIETGHRVWIGITSDKNRFAVGIAK